MYASFYFVVLLLVSFAVAEEESVYVCGVTGSDTNPCLQDSPCSTISKALASTNQTATSIMLNVCAGTYTGESNINITLPSIPITITKYAEPATQETDVIFDCEQNYPTGFTASNAVSFYTITIQSCSFGIQFIAQSDSQIITLQDTTINNCPVGVFVQGTNTSASVYQSSFLDSSVYISKASNIYFSGCAFQGVGAEYSILFESPEIELITLDSISFLDTSGIQAAVGPTTTASVSNCQFQGITSDIFTITGGDWWISQAEISSSPLCDTAILFQDINNSNTTGLTVTDSSINSCNSAIFFDAKAQIIILSTSINVPNKCIQITKATVVQIGGQTEADIGGITLETCLGIDIYYTQEPIFVNIFGVDFSDTFSMNITVASGSNSNWMYSTITESSAFVLNGGNWTLESINMVGYYPNFRSNGSMLYLDSSDSSLGVPSVSIRNSNLTGGYTSYFGGCIYATNVNLIVDSTNFENCTAESGGALYANSFEELIVTNCTFYSNAALGNGGAVALESSSNEGIDGNFAGCLFSGNSAPTGSAISCCTSNSDCDITVVYVDDNPVTFEDNENTDASGDTVTCKTVTKGVSSFYDDNGDSDSGIPDYWVYWIILGGMILLVTLGIIITVTVMVIYKKRMSYESIE